MYTQTPLILKVEYWNATNPTHTVICLNVTTHSASHLKTLSPPTYLQTLVFLLPSPKIRRARRYYTKPTDQSKSTLLHLVELQDSRPSSEWWLHLRIQSMAMSIQRKDGSYMQPLLDKQDFPYQLVFTYSYFSS